MYTNNNMMNLIQMACKSGNPQDFIFNMIQERAGGNQFFMNLLSLAREGKTKDIESIARNAFKEQGRDFDAEFNNFMRAMKF